MGCWSKRSRRNIPENNTIEVELKIWMHCENCVKDVKKAMSKFEGVEACKTDMENQKVMVTGNFNLEKLLKNLKKKTGKKAEILTMNEKVEKEDVVQNEANEQETVTKKNEEGDIVEKKDETPEVEEKIDKPETSTRKLEIHIAFLSEKYEADIGKVISKFEGVKTCKVDVENKKVVITGDFDEEKLWKELEEKMRKRIVKMGKEKKDDEPITKDEENEIDRGVYMNPSSDDEKEMARWMMFSDENPNACSIS